MNTPWKVVLAFIAVFVLGTIFGGGFALRINRQAARREEFRPPVINPMPQRTANPQPPVGTQLLRRFVEGLDLTTEQRDKLRPLVLHAEEQIAAVRQKGLDETEQILRDLQQAFRAELKPEQLRKLNRMQQKQMENIRAERLRRQQQPGFNPNPPFSQPRPGQRMNPGQPGQPQGPLNPPPRNFGPGQPQPQDQGPAQFSPPGPPPGGQPQNPPPPEGAVPVPRNP